MRVDVYTDIFGVIFLPTINRLSAFVENKIAVVISTSGAASINIDVHEKM